MGLLNIVYDSFSLDLWTHNLIISRIWLKIYSLKLWATVCGIKIQKWQSMVLKLAIHNYFENIDLNPTINI